MYNKNKNKHKKDFGQSYLQNGWIMFTSKKLSTDFKTYIYKKKSENDK